MKSHQEIWKRELTYLKQLDIWKSFAVETKCCADFLLRKYMNVIRSSDKDDQFRAFFGYKYVRMLSGYALENLIKGLLLSGPEKETYIKNDQVTFGNNCHNLIWLLQKLGVSASDEENFYLEAWSISAEWYGKYPFPLGMNKVMPEYQSLASSEALLKRSAAGKRECTHNDLLHQQIGNFEESTFENFFNTILKKYVT